MSPEHTHHYCPYWLAGSLDNPLQLLLQNPKKILSGLVADGQTALDLGCGPGVFTEGLARLVGSEGLVVGVDMQQAMLERARRRIERAGLQARVRFERCPPERIGLQDFTERADFALAFWIVHEVPDPASFLAELSTYLKPGGRLLIIEPSMIVSRERFAQTAAIAIGLGLVPIGHPKVVLSQTVLLQKLEIITPTANFPLNL